MKKKRNSTIFDHCYQYEDPETLDVKEERGTLEWCKYFALRHLRTKNYSPRGIFNLDDELVFSVQEIKEMFLAIKYKKEMKGKRK